MENNLKEQQIEALEVFEKYNKKLMKSMNTIIGELRGDRKEDTDEFQEKIIEGLNWEIQILNKTLSLINEKRIYIKKEEINEKIICLSEAIKEGDSKIAEVLENDIIPTFEEIGLIVKNVLKEL